MAIWKPGDRVRLTWACKRYLCSRKFRSQRFLADELGDCVGVVIGPVDFGAGGVGPEVDVRWKPGNLRYAFHPDDLEAAEELNGNNQSTR